MIGWYKFRLEKDAPDRERWGLFDPSLTPGGPGGPPPGMAWHDGPHGKPPRPAKAPGPPPPEVLARVAADRERVEKLKRFQRTARGACAYKGDLIVKAEGCRAGIRCTYECDHPDPAKQAAHPGCIPLYQYPAGGCPHWSDRVEPGDMPDPLPPGQPAAAHSG